MTIAKCTCKHNFQDATYGKGNRVHTVAKDGKLRCTVCSGPGSQLGKLISHAKNWAPQYSMPPKSSGPIYS